jgi:predicted DCC family thiol-disulfide oxidoreductase YuxK
VDIRAVRMIKPIILYDDRCGFCVAQINMIKRIDFWGRFNFDSLYEYPHIPKDSLCILDANKNLYIGAHAFKYMARYLILLWPLWILMSIPCTMKLWEYIYKLIAKNRYKIYGKCDSACGFNKSKS